MKIDCRACHGSGMSPNPPRRECFPCRGLGAFTLSETALSWLRRIAAGEVTLAGKVPSGTRYLLQRAGLVRSPNRDLYLVTPETEIEVTTAGREVLR